MWKIRCRQTRRDIAGWLDLSPAERRRVQKHVRSCAACQAELEETREVLARLQASRPAYSELHYTGPRPSFRAQRALTPALGIRTVPSRGYWKPLPVAIAGGLFAISLAIFLLRISQPTTDGPPSPPAPAIERSDKNSLASATRPATPEAASVDHEETDRTPPPPGPETASKVPKPLPTHTLLETIRQQTGPLRMPTAPKRPVGLGVRLPARPTPPPHLDRPSGEK